ncbi:DUF11 domain-containing protein, partial [Streptomyces bambusae]|nr:DUF11 domain-containing protein [Streptomyces bambusae]
PLAAAAAPADAPDPGRIAYAGEGTHHSVHTVADGGSLSPLLPVGTAGNDCQPAARGDDLVWVSDRSGQGEGIYRRTGDGPATLLHTRSGWRLADPVLSPDRQWVAFVSWPNDPGDGLPATRYRCDDRRGRVGTDARPGVWVVRTDGTGLRPVAEDADTPDWSPDGTQLLYTHGPDAFRVPAAGGTPVRVSPPGDTARYPVWEPGGKDRIAYLSPVGDGEGEGDGEGDGNGNYEVVTVPAGAGGATPPTVLAVADPGEGGRLDLAWRPDAGRLLALVGEPYLVDPAAPCRGCPGTPLFDPDQFVPFEMHNVAWYTPAGARPGPLVAGADWEESNIERQRAGLPLDRVQLRAAQGREYGFADPAYAPDARRMAFVRLLGGFLRQAPDLPGRGTVRAPTAIAAPSQGPEIMIGEVEGLAQARSLTYQGMNQGENQSRPAWSPDGTRLAFARRPASTAANPYPRSEIAVVDVSGAPAQWKLLATVARRAEGGMTCRSDDLEPAWSADGTRLAFSRWSECTPVPVPVPAPPGSGGGTSDGSSAPPREGPPTPYADRHIWTANAADGQGQFDVTGAQCGAQCAVIDQRPAYDPRGTDLAFVRQAHYVDISVHAADPAAASGPAASGSAASGPAAAAPTATAGVAAPVGAEAATASLATSEPSMLLLAAADGRSCRRLLPRGTGCPLTVPERPAGQPYADPDSPAWAPGGHRLAVDVRLVARTSGDRRLLVIDPDNDGGPDDHTEFFPGTTGAGQTGPTWEPSTDLHLELTAPEPSLLLDATGKLVLDVRNDGIAPSPRTRVRFTLPAGLTATGPPVPGQGTCTAALVCELGALAAAGGRTRVEIAVKAAALGTHEARADAETALPDHRPADNGATTRITVVVPDLATTATATPAELRIDERTTVEFTVRNSGTAPAENSVLRTTVPAGLTLVTGTACPADGCPLGTLKPGEEKKLTWVYTAAEGLTGTLEGRAVTSTRGGADGNPDNDRAAVDLTFVDPRRPDPAVTVTATPAVLSTGEPSTVTYKVTNLGDAPAKGVTLIPVLPAGMTVLSADPPCPAEGCALGDLAPGASVTVTRVVSSATARTGTATGTVATTGPDGNPANNTASATLVVTDRPPPPPVLYADPAVAVTATPPVAYTGGRITAEITVRNTGALTATGLTLRVTVPPGLAVVSATRPDCETPGGCALPDLTGGQVSAVRLELAAGPALTGAVTGSVTTTGPDAFPRNNTASAPVTVRRPTLELSPPLGPPGSVTQAHGSQFPPGAPVDLRWSRGVTVASAPVVAAADGTFSAPVLILVQDTLGERELTATHAGGAPPLYSPVSAPYLVVPGVLQPSDFQWRR